MPWPYFLSQGPRPLTFTLEVSVSMVGTLIWCGQGHVIQCPSVNPARVQVFLVCGAETTHPARDCDVQVQHSFWALGSSHWSLEGKQLPGTLTPLPQVKGQYRMVASEGPELRGRDSLYRQWATWRAGVTSDMGMPGEWSRKNF